jgi:hypothetical protein
VFVGFFGSRSGLQRTGGEQHGGYRFLINVHVFGR